MYVNVDMNARIVKYWWKGQTSDHPSTDSVNITDDQVIWTSYSTGDPSVSFVRFSLERNNGVLTQTPQGHPTSSYTCKKASPVL